MLSAYFGHDFAKGNYLIAPMMDTSSGKREARHYP